MSERAAAAKPWPRISTTLWPPRPRARSWPWGEVGDEEIRVPESIGDVPHRYLGAHEAAGVNHWAKRRLGHGERQHRLGMGVDDGHHVWPRLVDRAVDEALQIERPLLLPSWQPVESELDDGGALDQLGCDRASQQVATGIVRMAVAHVTVGVDDVHIGQNAVGDHELAHDPIEVTHSLS